MEDMKLCYVVVEGCSCGIYTMQVHVTYRCGADLARLFVDTEAKGDFPLGTGYNRICVQILPCLGDENPGIQVFF